MEEKCFFYNTVSQQSEPEPPSSRWWAENRVLITLSYYKVRGIRLNRNMPFSYEQFSTVAERSLTAVLSSLKLPSNQAHYAREFYEDFTSMGVPHVEQEKLVQQLFTVIAAAVSTNNINMGVFDTTLIYPRREDEEGGDGHVPVPRDVVIPKSIPASKSSIQGLEPVTLDDTVIPHTPDCPVCLEDFSAAAFVEEPITALPCGHHYHVHCIVQWLEMSHLCPLCRYPMPIEDDHSN